MEPLWLHNVISHRMEFVMRECDTEKYRDILKRLNEGERIVLPTMVFPGLTLDILQQLIIGDPLAKMRAALLRWLKAPGRWN